MTETEDMDDFVRTESPMKGNISPGFGFK